MDSLTPEPDDQAAVAKKRVGTLIGGKWRVQRVLGIGGMAVVYLAIHEHNKRMVAIKVLHEQLCQFDDLRERFVQEAHAANRVQHRGAVPALDDGVLENGTPYLVLDFLEGHSLDHRWRKHNRQLSVEEVFGVAEQLLEILETAHQNGVLHRDIKPENVFLTTDGEVKLLDFGISSVSGVDRTHKTKHGATMGTPAFMSPEQARGRWSEIDARSEVFAVGATMYTLLSGHTIHDAETANELLLSVMTKPVVDLRKVAPHVPEYAAQVVNRSLAFFKESRYQSAAEMRQAVAAVNATFDRGLHTLLDQEGYIVRKSSVPPSFPSHGSTHRPVIASDWPSDQAFGGAVKRERWVTAALVALMIATGGISYAYFRQGDPADNITFSPVSEQGDVDVPRDFAGQPDSTGSAEKKNGSVASSKQSKKHAGSTKQAADSSPRPSAAERTRDTQQSPPVPAKNGSTSRAGSPGGKPVDQELDFDPLARRR